MTFKTETNIWILIIFLLFALVVTITLMPAIPKGVETTCEDQNGDLIINQSCITQQGTHNNTQNSIMGFSTLALLLLIGRIFYVEVVKENY